MRFRLVPTLGIVALLAAGSSALAQNAQAAPDETDEPVRVYTNADLDDLPPLPTQETEPPTPEEIARRWAFVDSVLDRAHARIDADRRHDLDRRLTEAEAGALERVDAQPHYVLPYAYGYAPVYDGGWGKPGPGFRHQGPRSPFERPMGQLFRPIAPLHARPHARPF